MTETLRLAKRVADLFSCSRREAQLYIEGGWVQVDGVVIEEAGARVQLQQDVRLLPGAVATEVPPVTLLLHKPAGVDCVFGPVPAYHPLYACLQVDALQPSALEQMTGGHFVKRHLQKLNACTMLSDQASGLMVLTQDWHIERKLLDDASSLEQEYVVQVAHKAGQAAEKVELAPILAANLSGVGIPGLKMSWQNEQNLRVVFKGGLRGEYDAQLALLCSNAGLEISASRRIRIGRVAMAALPAGRWRYLRKNERF